jgi:hypothetical protein
MPASDAAGVGPGTRLKIAGGGLPLMGMENMGVERAVLASQESLFDPGYDDDGRARFNSEGRPLCPDCGRVMDAVDTEDGKYRDYETMGGYEIDYYWCPVCQREYELIEGDITRASSGAGRGRGRRRTVAVGAPGGHAAGSPVDVGAPPRQPGVAMASRPEGIEEVLINPAPEARAALGEVLGGFGELQPFGADGYVIDTSVPFAGDTGRAYASLVQLHRLISQRGVPPDLFRKLRDWVSGW